VKENVKRALSSHEIVNWFSWDETRRNEEEINEKPLHFEADDLCFGNFLNSEEQKVFQLRMVDGDGRVELNELHQMLE
jgi:hypothetical protein